MALTKVMHGANMLHGACIFSAIYADSGALQGAKDSGSLRFMNDTAPSSPGREHQNNEARARRARARSAGEPLPAGIND
jgi:hypothetical protein